MSEYRHPTPQLPRYVRMLRAQRFEAMLAARAAHPADAAEFVRAAWRAHRSILIYRGIAS